MMSIDCRSYIYYCEKYSYHFGNYTETKIFRLDFLKTISHLYSFLKILLDLFIYFIVLPACVTTMCLPGAYRMHWNWS